jgi:hypothetical protein
MPATLEGYYQEIGRAGRDGRPARAVLLWSWGDRKIHESFLARDYPEVRELSALRGKVPAGGMARDELALASKMTAEAADSAIDKLLAHGGIAIQIKDGRAVVVPGHDDWQSAYEVLRQHRYAQLDDVLTFAQAHTCRMVQLIRHFGDSRDRHACGVCDICAADGCVGRSLRAATANERLAGQIILDALAAEDGIATGALFRRVSSRVGDDRREFERLLAALVRAQRVHLSDDEFDKEGATIRFRRAHLARLRASLLAEDLLFDDYPPAKTKGRRPASMAGTTGRARKRIRKKHAP